LALVVSGDNHGKGVAKDNVSGGGGGCGVGEQWGLRLPYGAHGTHQMNGAGEEAEKRRRRGGGGWRPCQRERSPHNTTQKRLGHVRPHRQPLHTCGRHEVEGSWEGRGGEGGGWERTLPVAVHIRHPSMDLLLLARAGPGMRHCCPNHTPNPPSPTHSHTQNKKESPAVTHTSEEGRPAPLLPLPVTVGGHVNHHKPGPQGGHTPKGEAPGRLGQCWGRQGRAKEGKGGQGEAANALSLRHRVHKPTEAVALLTGAPVDDGPPGTGDGNRG
jgi:hypothetical protein